MKNTSAVMENVANEQILQGETMKCLPSKVMEVPVHLVQFANYQRPVDMKKVEAIMREFNPRRVRPIELSYRDGVYYCFDGQHRLRAYQRLGQTKIEAQVHFGLTYKEEAKLFADQHRNEKHISKRDEWRARVLAGNADAGASAVSETLRVYGYTMDICPQTGLTPVGAINEIQKLYDETGLPGLNSALAIATGAWGNTREAVHREILSGLRTIVKSYSLQKPQIKRFIKKLSAFPPNEILKKSATVFGRGGKRTARCMVDYYNRNLRNTSSEWLNPEKLK